MAEVGVLEVEVLGIDVEGERGYSADVLAEESLLEGSTSVDDLVRVKFDGRSIEDAAVISQPAGQISFKQSKYNSNDNRLGPRPTHKNSSPSLLPLFLL